MGECALAELRRFSSSPSAVSRQTSPRLVSDAAAWSKCQLLPPNPNTPVDRLVVSSCDFVAGEWSARDLKPNHLGGRLDPSAGIRQAPKGAFGPTLWQPVRPTLGSEVGTEDRIFSEKSTKYRGWPAKCERPPGSWLWPLPSHALIEPVLQCRLCEGWPVDPPYLRKAVSTQSRGCPTPSARTISDGCVVGPANVRFLSSLPPWGHRTRMAALGRTLRVLLCFALPWRTANAVTVPCLT